MRAQPFVNERAELAIIRLQRLTGLHLLKQIYCPGLGLLPLPVKGFAVPVTLSAVVLAHKDADEPPIALALPLLILCATVDYLAGAPMLGLVWLPCFVVRFVGHITFPGGAASSSQASFYRLRRSLLRLSPLYAASPFANKPFNVRHAVAGDPLDLNHWDRRTRILSEARQRRRAGAQSFTAPSRGHSTHNPRRVGSRNQRRLGRQVPDLSAVSQSDQVLRLRPASAIGRAPIARIPRPHHRLKETSHAEHIRPDPNSARTDDRPALDQRHHPRPVQAGESA